MRKTENVQEYLSKIKDGEKVYAFLTGVNDQTPKGRRDFNENLYVNVVTYKTKKAESFDGIFEVHRDYTDLQVILSGEERLFYGDKKGMTLTKEYDKAGDYELLKGENYSFVDCGKMQGIEFTVNEPHMGGYAVKEEKQILKAIVKIRNS